jgi:hypothetical protein
VILWFARESNGFNRSLGTPEHEENGYQETAIGSTHTAIFALSESLAHAKSSKIREEVVSRLGLKEQGERP